MTTARKIGAPDTLFEEHVSAEQSSGLRLEKSNMSWRVAWYEQNVKLHMAKVKIACVIPPSGGFVTTIHRNAPRFRSSTCLIKWKIKTMEPEWQLRKLLHNTGHGAKMVEVSVSQPDCSQLPSFAGNSLENLRRIGSWVNNHTITTTFICCYEAVGCDRPDGHFFNREHDFCATLDSDYGA